MAHKKELFESSSVLKAVLSLAMPSVMGQIILVVYNMADTLFVGMTNSDEMITAVTVCMPAFMFLSAISNLFGVGASSVMSRALGVNDKEKAKSASCFSIWSCLAVTVLYCAGVLLFMDKFIDALGGSNPVVHRNAVEYMKVAVVYGGVATAASTLLSHIIRSGGYSMHASLGIVIGGVLNIILDPLFMFVILEPGNEAFGAAAATALSNIVAVIYYITVTAKYRRRLSIRFKPDKRMFSNSVPADVFKVGVPACLMTLCENISYAVLDNLMVAAGTAAQAGIGVAKKVNMLAHCIVRGMTQGVLPLIGYNYASGNRKRMKSVVYVSLGISTGISLLCMTAFLLFSKGLIGIFIHTASKSLEYGSDFLKILCLGTPFSTLAYTVISFFQATGRGGKSLILALLRKGILDIPMMFVLNIFVPTYGIVMATPITDVVCSVVALILFCIFIHRHGQNKKKFLSRAA